MSGLRPLDRFQIATTGLILMLGVVILMRAWMLGAPAGSYVVGVAFVAYGAYRAKFIVRALRGGGRSG
jgi:hypothetical protein